jgi:hypothetical protein
MEYGYWGQILMEWLLNPRLPIFSSSPKVTMAC